MADGSVTVRWRGGPDIAVGVAFDVGILAGPEEDEVEGLFEDIAGGRVVSSGENSGEEGFVVRMTVMAEREEALGKRRGLEECGAEIVRTAVVGCPDFVE